MIMKKSQAFSLIELSIVIMVIGLIMAGITISSNMIQKSKLVSAKTLTTTSPVSGIASLKVWYEATSDNSFISSEALDSSPISLWRDLTPANTIKNNAVQRTYYNFSDGSINSALSDSPSNKPTYTAYAINNLPAVGFTRSNNSRLAFDASFLAGSDYTIFVVEQRTGVTSANQFFLGTFSPSFATCTQLNGLQIGYATTTTSNYRSSNAVSFISYTISSYSTPNPKIHAILMNSTSGKTYLINGFQVGALADTNRVSPCQNDGKIGTAYDTTTNGTPFAYDGYIGEVIIYNRALTTDERKLVENYLSKKWGITLGVRYNS